jgi:hypothetical protein
MRNNLHLELLQSIAVLVNSMLVLLLEVTVLSKTISGILKQRQVMLLTSIDRKRLHLNSKRLKLNKVRTKRSAIRIRKRIKRKKNKLLMKKSLRK